MHLIMQATATILPHASSASREHAGNANMQKCQYQDKGNFNFNDLQISVFSHSPFQIEGRWQTWQPIKRKTKNGKTPN